MVILPDIIKGNTHCDERGMICFVNDFDMTPVRRFYRIVHQDIHVIRGWRAHKIEQRWFNVTKGAFSISLVRIDSWSNPSPDLPVKCFELLENENVILHVPPGYASLLRAIEPDSSLLVFGDYDIEHAQNDNYLYATNYFTTD